MSSGTEKMKEKIKQKMSFDDLSVPQNTRNSRQEPKISSTLENQLTGQPTNEQEYQRNSKQEVQQTGNPPLRDFAHSSHDLPSPSLQPKKRISYKMTFNLDEESFNAFNNIYAKRMLEGRKTEKINLITEAIELLIQHEERRTANKGH